MTELWSGPGCEESPDYELVERDPGTGIGRFRKVARPEYIGDAPGRVPISKRADDEDPILAAIRALTPEQAEEMFRRYLAERGRSADPELADAAERRLTAAMRGPTKKENVHVEFNKKDAFASIDAAIETLAKVEFPDRDTATAVAKFLDTDAGRELYTLRDVAYSVRESGVEFAKIAADAALETEAARIRKADPTLSAEGAYCRALEARPELYDLYLSGSAE